MHSITLTAAICPRCGMDWAIVVSGDGGNRTSSAVHALLMLVLLGTAMQELSRYPSSNRCRVAWRRGRVWSAREGLSPSGHHRDRPIPCQSPGTDLSLTQCVPNPMSPAHQGA